MAVKARQAVRVGPNAKALAATLKALRDLGRLELVDEAVVALCRSTAKAVDQFPERATLVKEYRECLVLLSDVGVSDGSDELEALLEALHASLGDDQAAGT